MNGNPLDSINNEELSSRGLGHKISKTERLWRTGVSEILFCCHVIVIICFIILCFILRLPVIILVLILWKVHLVYFDGCIFTLTQRMIDGKPRDYTFTEDLIFRITGTDVGQNSLGLITILLTVIVLIVTITATYYRYKFYNFDKTTRDKIMKYGTKFDKLKYRLKEVGKFFIV